MTSKWRAVRFWICTVAVTWSLFAIAAAQAPATATNTGKLGPDSYEWHGEFVALEESARMLTIKSPAVGEALKDLAVFRPGDKVVLTWSGFDKFAHAVNGASKYAAGKTAEARFAFPVEFVEFDPRRGYVTFKAQIPESSVSRVKSLRPGEWVTATSMHGVSSYTQPIASVRGFTDVGNIS